MARLGRLACEACGFDFAERYGDHGRGFIECHHTRPVHTLRPDERTKLGDLALLCANCHRMIHARRPWLSLDELHARTARACRHPIVRPGAPAARRGAFRTRVAATTGQDEGRAGRRPQDRPLLEEDR